jgi:hypothetical protein
MIIVRLSGGMGNQMFQYALGRVLSIKHNVPLKLDTTFLFNQTAIPLVRKNFVPRPYALDVFTIEADSAKPNEIPWYGKPFFSGILMQAIDALLRKLAFLPGWEKSFTYSPRVLEYGPNTYLAGFWQSEKYFAALRPVLQKDFELSVPIGSATKKLLEDIVSTVSVCVHIRRSDIAASSFHDSVSLNYYTNAVAHINKNRPIEKLYVFSDDIGWCKEHVRFSTPTVYVENDSAGTKNEGHFALMRACKHFVIANSTFSWWAAWLAENPDKIVVAPKKWFGRASIDDRDLVPEDWIRI